MTSLGRSKVAGGCNLRVSLKLRLGVHKGMEWNNHKRMEMNGMYLSKGKEWNGMELSNLDWMF